MSTSHQGELGDPDGSAYLLERAKLHAQEAAFAPEYNPPPGSAGTAGRGQRLSLPC